MNNFKNTTNTNLSKYCTAVNCVTYRTNITNNMGKIKVYVGNDKKLHFVNSGGTDTALNFSNAADQITKAIYEGTAADGTKTFIGFETSSMANTLDPNTANNKNIMDGHCMCTQTANHSGANCRGDKFYYVDLPTDNRILYAIDIETLERATVNCWDAQTDDTITISADAYNSKNQTIYSLGTVYTKHYIAVKNGAQVTTGQTGSGAVVSKSQIYLIGRNFPVGTDKIRIRIQYSCAHSTYNTDYNMTYSYFHPYITCKYLVFNV